MSFFYKIQKGNWHGSWLASDQQLQYVLNSLNFTTLYDVTQGQYSPADMDFWYYLQQPFVRKAANIGNRTLSDGLAIYRAMIEDTMKSARPQIIEAMENYKVKKNSSPTGN